MYKYIIKPKIIYEQIKEYVCELSYWTFVYLLPVSTKFDKNRRVIMRKRKYTRTE